MSIAHMLWMKQTKFIQLYIIQLLLIKWLVGIYSFGLNSQNKFSCLFNNVDKLLEI